MNLLAGTCYDPGTAATASTASLLAMTAIDTTNLRLQFTVPWHGKALVRIKTVVHGATTVPQVLLGVLEGSTVRGRMVAMAPGIGAFPAATAHIHQWAEFLVTGLTPGSLLTWDAAYGVDVVVASTALKWGGPNDTTTNNAFGGFAFEIYDPQPVPPGVGGVNTLVAANRRIRGGRGSVGFGGR